MDYLEIFQGFRPIFTSHSFYSKVFVSKRFQFYYYSAFQFSLHFYGRTMDQSTVIKKRLAFLDFSISIEVIVEQVFLSVQINIFSKKMLSNSIVLILISIFYAILQVHTRKLIYVQQIFRHGARYPIRSIKNDDSGFVEKQRKFGELTNEGRHMQYTLGKIMYDKYWNQLFAGTEYENKYHPTQIYVKSTNINRTIESAQAQLQGLLEKLPVEQMPISQLNYSFPPFVNAFNYQEKLQPNQTYFDVFGSNITDFHTVPIHMERDIFIPESDNYKFRANPYDEGDFLIKYDQSNCPNQKFWSKENMASDDAIKIKNSQKIANFLSALSNAVNTKVKYEEAWPYIDNFYCLKHLGYKYLFLFNDTQFLKTSNFVILTEILLSFFYTDDQIKISNTRLLQETIARMKRAQAGTGPKLVLFSAHDTTILSVATALQLISVRCVIDSFLNGVDNSKTCITTYPPFASNIIFELWEEDNLTHTIKVLYNGVQKSLPICNNQYSCSFAQFEQWANNFYIDDPNDTCGIRQQYTKLYIVIGVLSLFIVVFVIIEMSKKIKKQIEKNMEEMEEKKGYIENFQEKEHHQGGKVQN